MGLLSLFTSAKINKVGDSLVMRLAQLDPATMSEAGMLELEQQLDSICQETARAKSDYLREQKEAETIQALFNQRMAAADHLTTAAEAATDDAKKAQINASLEKLLNQIEGMAADVDREHAEAAEAKALFEELEATSTELATQFKGARQEFEQLQRGLQKAEAQEQRANAQAERAKTLAGIKTGGNRLGTALGAMKQAQTEAENKAQAAVNKANLLKTTKLEDEDTLIADALKAASGESTTTSTAAERLAALRGKQS